jgi:hypothetical protein
MNKLILILAATTAMQATAADDIGTISREELLTTLTKALAIIDPVDPTFNSVTSIPGYVSTSNIVYSASVKTPTVLESLVERKEREKKTAEEALTEARKKLELANTIRNIIERLNK